MLRRSDGTGVRLHPNWSNTKVDCLPLKGHPTQVEVPGGGVLGGIVGDDDVDGQLGMQRADQPVGAGRDVVGQRDLAVRRAARVAAKPRPRPRCAERRDKSPWRKVNIRGGEVGWDLDEEELEEFGFDGGRGGSQLRM